MKKCGALPCFRFRQAYGVIRQLPDEGRFGREPSSAARHSLDRYRGLVGSPLYVDSHARLPGSQHSMATPLSRSYAWNAAQPAVPLRTMSILQPRSVRANY
jgi:hypothetical protein